MKRGLVWLLISVGLLFAGANSQTAASRGRGGSLASRLLGPVRGVASSVQWIRFDSARRDGDYDLAYSRAETAIRLNPNSTAGWMLLARHLSFDRGAPGDGTDPQERAIWLNAGLEILERGKTVVSQPEELAIAQGTFMAAQASLAPEDCVWPGGAKSCLEEAAKYFSEAGAADLAESALELAGEFE